jgi:phage baseplate assembly protein W
MNDDIKKAAEQFLSTEQGQRVAAKRGELEKLASGADGKKMQQLLGTDKAQKAAAAGDMKTLTELLQGALKTEEGARIVKQLQNLIK